MALNATDTDTGDAPGSSTGPELDGLTTDSLKRLQSSDERRLLDVVDKLRRIGLNGTIELPQLVVCGDQSSGKSSVLEAITEIPFPRKAGLCTRFATEIVLRRQPTSSVTIKINPSKLRTEAEQNKIGAFSKTITELSELPDVMEEATKEMGLGKIGESTAFSRDVLSVEICGPDRPQLTLVDLPGLIHSATKASTEADKELIFSLVQEYMENPRTIILAVVSAKNDAANQIILSLFKKIDKNGSRTLGIITKPDCISAEDEQFWFDLALNKEVLLERGWHMVKNRSDGEMQFSFQDRNDAEQAFFNKGRFKDLPRQSVGIEALRVRLSNLLLRHLVQELPSLKEEMKGKLQLTNRQLADLGDRRETTQEQKMMLMKISMQIHQIITSALNGHYLHNFFKPVDMSATITESTNIRRFRAVVEDLNYNFAENMRCRGHMYEFKDDKWTTINSSGSSIPEDSSAEEDNDDESVTDASFDDDLPEPKALSQEETRQWVKKMITDCRGHELPPSVNPDVTSHLFWKQSEPWKEIAESHIEQVRSKCKRFIHEVLKHAAPAEFQKPLEDLVVNEVLGEALKDGKEELMKLLGDKARHPHTYNHYFTDTLQKRRLDKLRALTAKAKKTATTQFVCQPDVFDQDVFQQEMAKLVEQDMENFAADEALDVQRAIYKDKLKVFVANVTEQVIERCMIAPLSSRIFSPIVVEAMTDEEVAFVAAELPEMVAQRAFLEGQKDMLEKGFEIFREAMGGVKRGKARR